MKQPSLLSLLFACLALGAACDDPVETESADLNYALVTFQEQPVPGVVQQGTDGTVEVLSGTFLIGSLGKCTSETRWRVTTGDQTTTEESVMTCRWGHGEGDTLNIDWTASGETAAVAEGAGLELLLPLEMQCVQASCPAEWTAVYEFTPPS